MNDLKKADDDFPEDDMFMEAESWEGEARNTQPTAMDY